MSTPQPADLIRAALRDTSNALTRLPGRDPTKGLLEVQELGPALRSSLVRVGVPADRVRLNHEAQIANWNRSTSQVDLVVLRPRRGIEIAAELKAWDIGHQLFDLAKLCCLLATGIHAAFLVCVAERSTDFERHAGGELFPPVEGEARMHEFLELITRHRQVWRHHAGKGTPEPTSIPACVTTTTVVADTPIHAYPGHCARAAQLSITDPTPIVLQTGGRRRSCGPPGRAPPDRLPWRDVRTANSWLALRARSNSEPRSERLRQPEPGEH